jgi:D-alanyl-D-alanine-carboxypeptidase/D-alanyl-D-alanine-endopeptidase
VKKIGLLLFLLAQFRFAATAQESLKTAQEARKLDTIARHAATSFIKGRPAIEVAVGIINNGQTHLYTYGAAKEDTNQTIYEIGSVSKTFASLVLAHAILEKKVNLSDDIRKYLRGDYPNLAYAGHPILILHLVNLTSGLPNNMPDSPDAFKDLNEDSIPFAFLKIHQHYTREHLLEDLHRVTLDTLPGVTPRHSNSAARLLVYILENIYRRPYPELVTAYILKPLQMNHTYFKVPEEERKYFIKGYDAKGQVMPYVSENDVTAFGLRSTIGDMTRYLRFELEENDQAVQMTHQPLWGDANSFALGMNWLMGKTFDGKRKINHDGTTFGFTTYVLLYPALKYGVVLMSTYDPNANDRLGEAAEGIFEKDYYTPAQRALDGFGFSVSINRLLHELTEKGFDHASDVADSLKTKDPAFTLDDYEVSVWASSLLEKGKKEQALAIYQLNAHLHPENTYVFDSLGQMYALLGNKELAIKNLRHSLELNPNNANATEQLKKLLK